MMLWVHPPIACAHHKGGGRVYRRPRRDAVDRACCRGDPLSVLGDPSVLAIVVVTLAVDGRVKLGIKVRIPVRVQVQCVCGPVFPCVVWTCFSLSFAVLWTQQQHPLPHSHAHTRTPTSATHLARISRTPFRRRPRIDRTCARGHAHHTQTHTSADTRRDLGCQ